MTDILCDWKLELSLSNSLIEVCGASPLQVQPETFLAFSLWFYHRFGERVYKLFCSGGELFVAVRHGKSVYKLIR